MPKTVMKDSRFSFKPTYSHAYDKFGNYVSLEKAIVIDRQSKTDWFLDVNKEVKLILAALDSDKMVTHWRAKPDQYLTTLDGKKHEYSGKLEGESFEHKRFKGVIIENSFFICKQYKFLIKDAKEEYTFENGLFRADVKAKLLDGTDCIIEVIKSSEISKTKESHLKEKQILTFKIYIDDDGNQIFARDCIIGNREIESIEDSIQKGIGAIAEQSQLLERIDSVGKNKVDKELQIYQSRINDRIRKVEDECFNLKEEIRKIERDQQNQGVPFSERRERIEREIKQIESEIERVTNSINEIEDAKLNKYVTLNKKIIEETIRVFNKTIHSQTQLLGLIKVRCTETNGNFCDLSEQYFNLIYNEQRKQSTTNRA